MKWVALVVLVIACQGSGNSPADSPPGAHPIPSCAKIVADLEALLAQGRGTCSTVADCTVVGGQGGPQFPTCNCAPYLISCPGEGVGLNAPKLAEIRALETQYWANCAGPESPALCDCPPIGEMTCEGYCRYSAPANGCFPP